MSHDNLTRVMLYLELVDHYIDSGLLHKADEYCAKVRTIFAARNYK